MTSDEMPLGRSTGYPGAYDPDLLFPVARAQNRQALPGADSDWPWYGEDRWQAWELGWLRPDGVPRVAVGEFRFPADSPALIESKSFKLYLNSLNGERFDSEARLRQVLERDLSVKAQAAVEVTLFPVDESAAIVARPPGARLIDDCEPVILPPQRPLEQLSAPTAERVEEALCSHLLRSLCPVTGQPDWGTLLVAYDGPRIEPGALLGYIIALREARDFHEHCVERIFQELYQRLEPDGLTVAAWYTRRGGLDINPWRSTRPQRAPSLRLRRQ